MERAQQSWVPTEGQASAVGNRSGTGKEEVGTKEAIDEVLSDL
jgi:hypothetical protein